MFEFDIVEHIATIGTSGNYTTELNRVSFNGNELFFVIERTALSGNACAVFVIFF